MHHKRQHGRTSFGIVTAIALAILPFLFCSCLDIPSTPENRREIEHISVYVMQDGILDSSLLKIHPSDSATLKVNVFPRQYKDDLSFEWIIERNIVNGHVTETLGTGDKYVIPPAAKEASIPTHLIIRDPLGSEMKISLDIAVNTPPHMDSLLSPTAGDTLYGSTSTAFEFRWQASDKDTELGDKLNYTLVIDGMRYNLGTLNHIRQSGFVPGPHSAYVIVTDSYGDLDSIAPQEFYVLDTLEGSL